MKAVRKDSIVRIQYRGTLSNGEVFDMCDESGPVEFEMGSGVMIQAFEDEILDMKLNEKKKFTIHFEKAYGPVVESAAKSFPLSEFETDSVLKPGDIVAVELDENETTPATVLRVDDQTVTIDMNHPLSGEVLNFEVEILHITEPEASS